MTIGQQAIEHSAYAMVAMMHTLIQRELDTTSALKKQGVLHSTQEVRKIILINGEPKELIIRPQYVFGAILSLPDRSNAQAEAVLLLACNKAQGTVVEAVVRLLEPRIHHLKDSAYLKRFATWIVNGLVSAKL